MATYVNLLEIKVIFASWMEPDGMKSQSPDFISKLPADGHKYLSGKLLYTFNNCLLRDIIGLNLKVEKLGFSFENLELLARWSGHTEVQVTRRERMDPQFAGIIAFCFLSLSSQHPGTPTLCLYCLC